MISLSLFLSLSLSYSDSNSSLQPSALVDILLDHNTGKPYIK